jgi:hypothetical protein
MQVTISWALQHGLVTLPRLASLLDDKVSNAVSHKEWLREKLE